MSAYPSQKQARMILDIETTCNPDAVSLMPDPKAPANIKDPEKIRAAIEEKRAEQIANAALDPDYGRILSIGMYNENLAKPLVVYINAEVYPEVKDVEDEHGWLIPLPEAGMLNCFWLEFAACRGYCVGYNILNFDLPYLMRRSMALGVKVPLMPVLAKFRTEPVTDLMMILYNWGADRYKGLKQVARLYGIPNDCPDVDGSMTSEMTAEQLRAYQISDLKLTLALYNRMNGVYFCHK